MLPAAVSDFGLKAVDMCMAAGHVHGCSRTGRCVLTTSASQPSLGTYSVSMLGVACLEIGLGRPTFAPAASNHLPSLQCRNAADFPSMLGILCTFFSSRGIS